MLAVRWLFPGTEIRIDTRCLDCGEPILVRMRDEDILEVNPTTTVGHMNIPFAKVLTGRSNLGFGLKPYEPLPVGRTREKLVAL